MAQEPETDVAAQLEHALNYGLLPGDATKTGDRLLRRLKLPVSVVILGPAGSGKSQLLNFLAGRQIVPPEANWPMLELAWGRETRTLVSAADGTVNAVAGLNAKAVTADAQSVRIEINLAILHRISLTELAVDGAAVDQVSPIDWAAKRADIALWCTQEFDPAEQALWASVPDELKDHSFCILTKADVVSQTDNLGHKINQIQGVVAEEFHSLVPLATLQAIAASGPDGAVDDKLLAASGGKALMASLLNEVALGRQADLDNAQLFLKRHGVEDLQVPVIEEVSQQEVQDISELSQSALTYLQGQAQKIADMTPPDDSDDATDVLELCSETANHVADIFIEQISAQGDVLNLQGDLMEAADVILLLQMEEGVGPAADAVTVLLQVQRDLQGNLAA